MSEAVTATGTDDDGAARWAIRIDAGPLSAAAQAELDAWLAADERRAGALLRAEAALAYLDRGRAFAGAAGDDAQAEAERAPLFGRRSVLFGGALAGALAAGLSGLLFLRTGAERLGTGIGEIRRVPLADGSVATINTASTLAVAIAPERRLVRLEQGEAWFQVAHDPGRPFIVEAGEIRVQAVGTAFSVRRRDAGADVLVTEGTVETWVVGRETARVRIAAGSRGFVGAQAPAITPVPAAEEIDRTLAWRTGELALDGETLDFAVAEINRYNRRQLVIADPALGREPLVGYFRTNAPENFGRAVASMLGARLVDEGETLRLVRQGG